MPARASRPYQGRVRAGAKGNKAGEARFGRTSQRFKGVRAAVTPFPIGASSPIRTGNLPGTSGPRFQLRHRGNVSPVRFERTLPSPSRWCLLPLGYEDLEPSPGADPGLLPYGGKVTSRV